MVQFTITTLQHLRDNHEMYYWRPTRPLEYLNCPAQWRQSELTGLVGLGMIGARDAHYNASDVIASIDFLKNEGSGEILASVEFGSLGQFPRTQTFMNYAVGTTEHELVIAINELMAPLIGNQEFEKANSLRTASGVLGLAELLCADFIAPQWLPGKQL